MITSVYLFEILLLISINNYMKLLRIVYSYFVLYSMLSLGFLFFSFVLFLFCCFFPFFFYYYYISFSIARSLRRSFPLPVGSNIIRVVGRDLRNHSNIFSQTHRHKVKNRWVSLNFFIYCVHVIYLFIMNDKLIWKTIV